MGNLCSIRLVSHRFLSTVRKQVSGDPSRAHQSQLLFPAVESSAGSSSNLDANSLNAGDQRPHCAGQHIIIDMWEASHLDDGPRIEQSMREAAHRAGARILHLHLHHFAENGGISGFAALAESHISVHTWPENSYAAFDIFMCGSARPWAAVEVLREVFMPARMTANEYLRGLF